MTPIIPNLAISGYRSFGPSPQFFDRFSKLNIIIGRNNSGKSNVLSAINELLSQSDKPNRVVLDLHTSHIPGNPPVRLGIGEEVGKDASGRFALPPSSPRMHGLGKDSHGQLISAMLGELLAAKTQVDTSKLAWSFTTFPDGVGKHDTWANAVARLDDRTVRSLCNHLAGGGGGGSRLHWEHHICINVSAKLVTCAVELVPAIRRIGESGVDPDGFDGKGIINRLAQLQNPSVEAQDDKLRFNAINQFLQEVTDHPEARIEIPYKRDTILVHMDNKVLPISSLGSGLHEVVILAAAATSLSKQVVCIEEPELHLNPVLQKKLVRYLIDQTDNQYFITTHSPAIMDTPRAETYHIRLVNSTSQVERVTSDASRAAVCEDLGYSPSDLILANCVIWVEGPSDRYYLNWWLHESNEHLLEGIHYTIMFYGGRLASHLSFAGQADNVTDFIKLRRLNHRGIIIIDSDKSKAKQRPNATKIRLMEEFNTGPGFAWITSGREIENYLPPSDIDKAIGAVIPSATRLGCNGRYENLLRIKRKSASEAQAPKVDVAKWIVSNTQPDLSIMDLRSQVTRIVEFIIESNPMDQKLWKHGKSSTP